MTQFRPSRFQILPPVIKNLVIINVLFYLAQTTFNRAGFIRLEDVLGLHHVKSPLFEPWQIITHLFLHGSVGHLFFNMFSLWIFGAILENVWGSKKFVTFYFICGIGAALLHLSFLWFDNSDMLNQFVMIKQDASVANVTYFFQRFQLERFSGASEVLRNFSNSPLDPFARSQAVAFVNDYTYLRLSEATIGASGAIAGVLAAFIFLYPNRELLIYFLFPVKAKWFGIVYFAYELFAAIANSEGDKVAHWAHLGGALVGFLLVLSWNRNNRRTFY